MGTGPVSYTKWDRFLYNIYWYILIWNYIDIPYYCYINVYPNIFRRYLCWDCDIIIFTISWHIDTLLTPYLHHILIISRVTQIWHRYGKYDSRYKHNTHIGTPPRPSLWRRQKWRLPRRMLPRLRRLLRPPRRRRRRRLATNARLARPSITTRRRRSPSRRGPSARTADTYHDWRNIYHDYIDTHII